MKLENDKFEKLKKSVFITKMNELSIESNLLQEHIKKINSLLDNALIIKKNNDLKSNEMIKIKENLEKQEKIENNRYEKLKKSLYATKMNELTVESNLLQTQINKLNSLLENALIIKRNNDQKNEEYTKIKENLEIFYSDKVGVGKSTQIKLKVKAQKKKYIHFPFGGEFSRKDVINRLKKIQDQSL